MSDGVRAPTRAGRPLLSICIPTYNRATCLEQLLACLAGITATHAGEVEVCISDNHSPDGTAQVLAAWRGRFPFTSVTQPRNLGATRNVAEVVRLATGRWLLVMGDDDLLAPAGVTSLLSRLRSSTSTDWILVGVGDQSGREWRLGDLGDGRYAPEAARPLLRRFGLARLGFIGMHVFPASRCAQLLALSGDDAKPWPHVALLLRHLADGAVQVLSHPVVGQAAAGKELFWSQADWVRINLRLLDITASAMRAVRGHRGFYYGVLLHELYAADSVKGLVYWRFFEPADFRATAPSAYLARYRLLGPLAGLAVAHAAFLAAVFLMPTPVFQWIERARGRGDTMAEYERRKALGRRFDGMQRGL